MFICNFKINKKKITKIFIFIAGIIAITLLAISTTKILGQIKQASKAETTVISDTIPCPEVANLTEENYTDVLKEVHDDLKTYIGQKISFTGYVYRVQDIKENEFILARDMIINNKNQTVVVGFLSSYEKAQDFENGSWVKVTGTIEKGYYYGDIPILKITEIEKVNAPENIFVKPPSDSYVPTAIIY